MELEPRYVDTAIKRWQDLTGEEALHADTGLNFNDLASKRNEDSSGLQTSPEENSSIKPTASADKVADALGGSDV